MKLRRGKETVELNDPIKIRAYKKSGWEEVKVRNGVEKPKDEDPKDEKPKDEKPKDEKGE